MTSPPSRCSPAPPRPILPSPPQHCRLHPGLAQTWLPSYLPRKADASFPSPAPALASSLPNAPYLVSILSHFSFVYHTCLGGGNWGALLNKPSHNTTTSSSCSPTLYNWHTSGSCLYLHFDGLGITRSFVPCYLASKTILYRHCSQFLSMALSPTCTCPPAFLRGLPPSPPTWYCGDTLGQKKEVKILKVPC